MKILFVTPSYFPIVGGSEVLTRNLATKLKETGIDADIMTFNMDRKWYPVWKEETTEDGSLNVVREPAFNPFPNLPNPLFPLFRMNVVPKLGFAARLKDYDIIHFVGEADLSFPLLSRFVNRPKLLQCVAIFRNGGIYKHYMVDRAFLGRIFKRFFSNLADIFVISSGEEKELLTEMGVPASRILILPIGVDIKIFHPAYARKIDNLILFVGRIYKIKGLHILLEALSYLKIPTTLAVVGPKWDREYSKEIEKMAEAINEKGIHQVMFLGAMNQDDLVSWYQKASILVCPYLYETHSNVVREALACGTPVVSTGTHLFENCHDGISVVPKNPPDLARAIGKLLDNREMRESYGKEGRKIIEQNFSWGYIVKDLTNIYEKMLNGKD
jgi:glycosyltransferase involved in cell wall biosynthesis